LLIFGWQVFERRCFYYLPQTSNDVLRSHSKDGIYAEKVQIKMVLTHNELLTYNELLSNLFTCVEDFKAIVAYNGQKLTLSQSFALLSCCRELFSLGATTSRQIKDATTEERSSSGSAQSDSGSERAEEDRSPQESSSTSPTA